MPDTLPNVVVPAKTVVDLYSATGLAVGTQVSVKMMGRGQALLYSGASLAGRPTDATGFTQINGGEELANDAGTSGAFIYSDQGCTVNVGEFSGSVVAGGF